MKRALTGRRPVRSTADYDFEIRHTFLKDNIWGADLTDMQLITKCNKGLCFLLCIINIFKMYVCSFSLKYKSIKIPNAFSKTFR